MTEPKTIPDLRCPVEHPPARLWCIGEGRCQAQCQVCLRHSPVVVGDAGYAMRRLDDLGWTTAPGNMWMCPVCGYRASARYSLAGE